jgi:hypothetical protein
MILHAPRRPLFALAVSSCVAACAAGPATRLTPKAPPGASSIAEKVAGMQALLGFFNVYWDDKEGKLWLEIDRWGSEFLYQSALAAGVGSSAGWIGHCR